MPGAKKTYDLICSLGGNCAVAHNLRYRQKRPFSLPFDWVYMQDASTVEYLIEGFTNRFSNLALRTNFKRIPGNEAHSVIYQDTYSGYCFPNHFAKPWEENDTYDSFYATLKKRTERLLTHIEKSRSVLFILATGFPIEMSLLEKLYCTLVRQFPHANIDLKIMLFSSFENKVYSREGLSVTYFTRSFNDYDTLATNYEWSFMDQFEWTHFPSGNPPYRQLFSIPFFSYKLKLLLTKKGNFPNYL